MDLQRALFFFGETFVISYSVLLFEYKKKVYTERALFLLVTREFNLKNASFYLLPKLLFHSLCFTV